MIDIHSHILHGVDDGAETFEVAIAMLKMACSSGTTDIVATPHASSRYAFHPDLVEHKIAELQLAVNNAVRIHAGCDFHLSATNIQDALANPAKYTINHMSYILVEFSDCLIPPSTDEIFEWMRGAGMVPIITHPERNQALRQRPELIEHWINNECLVQVTAQSFLGHFGRKAKTFADALMRDGFIHFVASDGHDLENRPPVLAEACRYIASNYGESQALRLFVTNPKATLSGKAIEPFESRPMQKWKWHGFR
jgi:protein-tyrosine phosphatase